jgi:hypothetical protein
MRIPAPILSALAASLLIACASAEDKRNRVPKDQIEESTRKIKELQKERIATLKEAVDQLSKLVMSARAEFGEVLEAQMMLLKAELDAAEKESDRIELYKKTIDALKVYEEWADLRVKAGRGTKTAALQIRARRLEVEIQLERAKIKEVKERK